MASNRQSEKTGLGKFVQKHSGYGTTTTKLHISNEYFIKHLVKPGDTLQGIALRYGVTMEKLKRDNQIWTNDSLFLREYLLVPMEQSPKKGHNFTNGSNHQDHSSLEIVSKRDIENAIKEKKKLELSQEKESRQEKGDTSKSAEDFLCKYDSALSQIKSSVQKLEEQTRFPDDSSNPLNHLPVKKTAVYGQRQPQSDSSDPWSSPELVIKSKARPQQSKSSSENSELKDEDLFQL